MSDDLRTGLVEAIGRAIYSYWWEDERAEEVGEEAMAEAALDAALGFLTDNAVMHVRYDENHSTELRSLQVSDLTQILRGHDKETR